MPLFRAVDSGQPYEWEGTLITVPPVSTQRPPDLPQRPRWLEMACYRLDSGGYLLHRTGYSVVYHDPAGSCAAGRVPGDRVTVAGLPDDAVRCADAPLAGRPRCQPPWPQDLGEDEAVMLERVRHTLDQCPDPAAVIVRASSVSHRREAVLSRGATRPVQELISKAAAADEGFARWVAADAASRPAERIG
jgi:hypothetical protein